MDHTAEIVLPHLVKLCASTKKIAAAKADATINIVIAHISYSIFLMKLIWSACDDKNVQPRKFATGWLKTLVGKHRENKAVFEKGEGLSLFEKCLKKGLADSNPDVRKLMRPTYWAFIRLWPERSENILSALSDQHRKVLITETAETASIPAPAKAATIAAAKSTTPKPKASIKDAIAAKRQAVKADKPVEAPAAPAAVVPTRTLSSAPVRPSRPARKPTVPAKVPSAKEVPGKEPSADFGKSTTKVVDRPATPPTHSRANSTTEAVRALTPDFFKSGAEPPKPSTPETAPKPTKSQRSNSITEAVRALTPDFSKSAAEPPKPSTPKSTSKPTKSQRSNSITDAVRALTPDFPKPATEPSRSSTPEAAPKTRKSQRSNSVTEACRALTPDWLKGAPAVSQKPAREESLFTPEKPSATSTKPASKVSEAPSCTSFDRPMKPIFSRKEGLARKALEELPVNEPTARPLSKMKHFESEKIRLTREKWTYVERHQLAQSAPARRDPINALRKRLRARLQRLKGSKGDLQDFRDVQSIIRVSRQVLDDEPELFDELLFTIFDLIESPNYLNYDTHNKGSDQNTQLLITLRVMLQYHTPLLSTYFPRALCALLAAARQQDDDTHMAIALEDTVKDIVDRCDVGNIEDSMDSILDCLESGDHTKFLQPLALGFFALQQLMKASDADRLCRPVVQEERLGSLAARGLGNPFTELRWAAVQFSLGYRTFLSDDDRFWAAVCPLGSDRLRLVTYWLSREQVSQAFRVEEESLNRAFGSLLA